MRIPATLSAFVLLTAAACSSGSNDDPDGGIDAGIDIEIDGGPSGPLARCGMAGKAELRSLQAASDGGPCDTWPTSGEHLLLEDSEAGPVLEAGAYRIPLIAGEGCTFTADTCLLEVPDGGDAQFDGLALTLQGTPGKLTLQWSSERVVGHTRETCATSGVFEAVPVEAGACEWGGAFRLAGEPTLVDGTCDAPWTWDPLTFQTSGDAPGIEVGGSFFDATGPIQDTCTARASKGGFGFPDGGSDFWIYNDALRWAELEATVDGDALTLRVTDRFAEPTEQVTCPGGTFEVHYARAPVEVTSLPTTCSAQRPWVHGDGQCENALGESCANSEDCRCNGGTQCVQEEGERAQCLSSCDFWADSCAAGTHCGRVFESGFPGSPFCFPDGPLERDAICSRDSECGSGLFCLRRQGVPQSEAGVCAPKCGTGLTCAEGDRCVPEKNSPFVDDAPPAGCLRGCDPWTSGSCSTFAPELKCFATEDLDVGVCRPQTAALPGLGEGCERAPGYEPTCQETLQCLSFSSRPSICAEHCTTNADCSGGKLCNYTFQTPQGSWKFCI